MNKLVINAYTDTDGGVPFQNFALQLNPVSISVTKSTDNLKESKDADGKSKSTTTATFQPAKITFKFTLDNTGVVDNSIDGHNIKDCINKLQTICVTPNDETHKNPYVHLTWGNTFTNFNYGQVTALKYDYTFFDRNGDALRAVVTLTVTEVDNPFSDRTFRSPDITRMPLIKDKDNLVKFSLDHYDDKFYYIKIAEANGLASVRELKNGNQLILPPLKK